MIARIVCLLIGYVFGNFQSAYLLGKRRGIDIREHGSGNSGSTNALRVMGTRAGLTVFIGDALKSLLAILLVSLLFRGRQDIIYLLKLYAFAGVVLGHDYPCFMSFKGGKGVAAAAGFVISFHWTFLPVAIMMFFVPFLTTHFVSLGSLLVYAGILVQMIVLGQRGFFGAAQPVLNEMYVLTALLAAMAYWKHRANIVRLLKGTESKTFLFQDVSSRL